MWPQQVQTPLRVQGEKKVQVQVRPQQVPSSFRIQGKEEVQVKMRPQQVQTPLRQAQMLGDAKAPGKKSGIDQRGNKGRLKRSMREGARVIGLGNADEFEMHSHVYSIE